MSRLVQTCQGPFHVWSQDQVGHVIGDGTTFWDWQLRPAIDAAAARQPEGWAIDLGAAFGWFTVYLAERFAHVLAVEASPETFQILQQNLRDHALSNVQAINWVAYDVRQDFTLVSDAMIGWPIHPLDEEPNASSIAFWPTDRGIHGGPLDPFVLPWPVALIKVDVQGCDLRAMKGLTQTIDRCRPTILFEYESGPSLWHGDTWDDYCDFLRSHRYRWTELPASNYWAEPEER